jgi:hypothetical protein
MIAIAKCGQRELSHRTSSPEDVEFTGEPLNQFVLSTPGPDIETGCHSGPPVVMFLNRRGGAGDLGE